MLFYFVVAFKWASLSFHFELIKMTKLKQESRKERKVSKNKRRRRRTNRTFVWFISGHLHVFASFFFYFFGVDFFQKTKQASKVCVFVFCVWVLIKAISEKALMELKLNFDQACWCNFWSLKIDSSSFLSSSSSSCAYS